MEIISLRYRPHAGQLAVHRSGARFRHVCCGRRWGKTRFAAAELLNRAGGEAGGDYGWIAPTYLIAERGQDAIREIAGGFCEISGKAPACATFRGAAGPVRLFFLSADNPDSILGFGFAGIVVDEAARIEKDVWTRNIRPTLSDKQGWAALISTPLGRNWFFDEFTRGKDGTDPSRASFQFPSNSSPYLPPEDWEDAKRTLPADIFRQEYMAEFLEDSAGAFRGIDECLEAPGMTPPATDDVVVGLDVAKHTDWTVAVAMDRKTGRCIEIDRYNMLDWPVQRDRVVAFARKYRALIHMDATGPGDPIYDDLKRAWTAVDPFVFTNATKTDLIQRLIVAIEKRAVRWPKAWETLTDELRRYEYSYTDSRRLSYEAPSGFHDDCVVALALANAKRREYHPAPIMPALMPGSYARQRAETRALRR